MDLLSDEYWHALGTRLELLESTEPNHSFFDVACIGKAITPERALEYLPYFYSYGGQKKLIERLEDARTSLSTLISAPADRIFFEHNTTQSMAAVVDHMRWRGANLVTTTSQYGSIPNRFVFPFRTDRSITYVEPENLLEQLERNIDDQTAAVLVSHVTHATCQINPVKEVVELAREKNIVSIIDGAQAVGHIPVDVEALNPDIYLGCGHKWLHTVIGSGFAYVAERLGDPDTFAYPHPLIPDELPSYLYHYMAHLADTVNAIPNWNAYFERIALNGKRAREVLEDNPYTIVLPNNAPGMVPIQIDGLGPLQAVEQLREYGVHVSPKSKEDIIRVSTSPFLTQQDMERLDQAIRTVGYSR